jgi:hypothetical protein
MFVISQLLALAKAHGNKAFIYGDLHAVPPYKIVLSDSQQPSIPPASTFRIDNYICSVPPPAPTKQIDDSSVLSRDEIIAKLDLVFLDQCLVHEQGLWK